MAPTFVSTLHVIVLAAVVIPGLADFNITHTSNIVIQSPQQSQLATLPDGYVAHPDIGVAYKVYNEIVRWTTARRRCISEGAHLADIDTQLKLAYLMTQVTFLYPWTGIHKMQGDTEWFSSNTGLAMTTLPWASIQYTGDAHCVFASKTHLGLVRTICNSKAGYACELPIPENYNAPRIDAMARITTT